MIGAGAACRHGSSMSSIETRIVSSAASSRALLLVGVLGDEIGDDDARVVQHDLAERDAVGEARALEDARPAEVDVRSPA